MAVYIGHDECRVIYVARNGQQRRVSSIWVGDQQVFPPAGRQEVHVFNSSTQGYGRVDNGTHFAFSVPVPWWATSADVVIIGAGEKGRDGTKSFTGGSDGAGGRSGAWVVKTVALTASNIALVSIAKGTSTSPHTTEMILPGVDGQADVRVYDSEGVRTANSRSTGGSVTPRSRIEFAQSHTGGAGGSRNNPGGNPGGGGGGGQGSNLIGNPQVGRDGGDGYVWLKFRSAPALNPGGDGFILLVGVDSGFAYGPLREWAVSIGKTYQTITEITVPMEVVGPSLQRLFYGCTSLTSVPELDTSQVTDMRFMFNNCHALASVPDLDTSKVTNMYAMFYGCTSLTSVPELDTSQVTNMAGTFQGCSSLTTIPAMDTSQVTDMYSMFLRCSSLASVPAMDTSQVTNMAGTFEGCTSLTSVPELDTSQVTTMYGMFYDCQALTSVPDLGSSQVTNIQYMFSRCSSLESVTLPGMGNGFTINRTLDMRDTKLNAAAANALMQSLGTVPAAATGSTLRLPATAAGADTSIATAKNWAVTIVGEGFILRVGVSSGSASAPLREWAVSIGKTYQTITEITVPMEVVGPSLRDIFYGCSALTSIPAMDTSQVTDMGYMFNSCSSLTTIPAMDTSRVTGMYSLFYGCTSLTSIPAMDTSQVTDPRDMFSRCSSLESVTLPGMGNGFTTTRTLEMKDTKLNAAAANALMQSLGTPPPGGTLQLPATAAGANTSIATAKNWQVTTA